MIDVAQDGSVRTLSLNRPPSNNLSPEFLAALSGAVREAAADPATRCLVLRSALPKYFSSGADLECMEKLPPEQRDVIFRSLLAVYRELAELPKPTLASIGGYALLGGWILAMACDFRLLAEESGRVSLSEIRLGLSPTTALISRLLALGGTPGAVREMVLKGRTLKASEAFAGGLVDRLVPLAALEAETASEARSLAKLPPRAFASVKASLAAAVQPDPDRVWRDSLDQFRRLFEGSEAQEGIAAMREKRRPRWE